MASSTEDYGSELQELQWGGGGSGSHFLRSGSNFLRSGTSSCYEAEDLQPSSRHHGGGQHRGYYSPPGTSYTIVERPPSAPHHHSSHTTPYRHRGHAASGSGSATGTGSGAISPEQVIRLFGNGVSSERRKADRRTPASSPASVAAVRSTPSSQSQQQSQQSQQSQSAAANPPTSPTSEPLSLQELTVRTIHMERAPMDSHHGFGICVKGGKDAGEIQTDFPLPPSPYFVPRQERGVGVYISRVEEGSVAERAGLRPGDTILEVNGTPFRAVTHEEALKMLKSCQSLSMTVRGPDLDPRCRGDHPVWSSSGRQQSCSWMDRQGRPASPPPLYPPRDSRYGPRTREVDLSIEPGQSLGLMIRGGLEYGLGIYVTGVDKDSVADRAGLLVGDQIIEVNGQSFEEATHDEAVHILKTNKRMTLLIRDVGKVPHSCTTSQPIVVPSSRYPEHDSLPVDCAGNHHPPSPTMGNGWRHRGGGVHAISADTVAMVEQKARVVLARSERAALFQLLEDYRRRRLTIEELVVRLGNLLNTHEKLTLLTELREYVDSKDLAVFDDLVYRPRVAMARRKGDRAHSDLIVTPSLHDLPRGVPASCCRPGRLVDVEGDPLGVTGPLLPRDNQEYRSPSEDSGLGADMPRTRAACRRANQHQVTTSDLALSNDDECENQDYDDELENGRGRRHSSPGGSRGARDYGHHHLHPDNLEGEGACDGSDAEMIGNGRRGVAGGTERDRDLEEDEDEGREERSSEGGGGGGFVGWRSHLFGGLTQRVKSWYWGARPLELAHKFSRSFDMQDAQLLEEGGTGGGSAGAGGPGGPPRRHHSAQRLARNDVSERREEDSALVVPDHHGNLRITVKKTKSILGIAIEGGANTKHPLPRIINIHDDGAAFEAGGLEVGQLILEVDGQKVEGMPHQQVARLIAESFASRARNEIEFLVVEAKKSNLEPKPTALIFLEA